MQLKNSSRQLLLDYVTAQVDTLFPDHVTDARRVIDRGLDETLDRLDVCVNAVAMWRPGEFDYLHSSQNCIFLYYLANTIWRTQEHENVSTKLFYLNKALNGFECFYDTPLPDKFFVGHTVGIVLVRTAYPEYFAVYQNCLVGQSNGDRPVIEERVLMYPGSSILGASHVRAGTVLAQGTKIVDAETPGESVAFSNGPELVFKSPKTDPLAQIFRL